MTTKFRVFPVDGYSYMATYHEYINSSDWWLKANEFKQSANYTCEECGLENSHNIQIHVHHKHYKTLGREKRNDVEVLCQYCHKLKHLEMNKAR